MVKLLSTLVIISSLSAYPAHSYAQVQNETPAATSDADGDNDFDWGWLGLLGLIGLAGLTGRRRDDAARTRGTNTRV
jgi:hypothetical protein